MFNVRLCQDESQTEMAYLLPFLKPAVGKICEKTKTEEIDARFLNLVLSFSSSVHNQCSLELKVTLSVSMLTWSLQVYHYLMG